MLLFDICSNASPTICPVTFWGLGFKDHPNIALILDFKTLFFIIVISLIPSLLKQIDIFEVPAELLVSCCASPETWPSFCNKVKWNMVTPRNHHIFLCIRKKELCNCALILSFQVHGATEITTIQSKCIFTEDAVSSQLFGSECIRLWKLYTITIITEQVAETNSSIEVSFASAVVQLEWSRHSFPPFFCLLFCPLCLEALFKVTNGLNLQQMQEIVSFDSY